MGQQCSINFEDIDLDSPYKIEYPGNREKYVYFKMESEMFDKLDLKGNGLDLYITAEAEGGLLRGVYFAESAFMPNKETWYHPNADQKFTPIPKRKQTLAVLVKHEDLTEIKKRNAAPVYHLTVALDARPKIKADGKRIADQTPVQAQLLITTTKARRPVHLEFEIPQTRKKSRERKEAERKADEAKEKKQVDGKEDDSKEGEEEEKNTTEKIYYPPENPWEDFELGLHFKDGTTIVGEAIGRSNDIRPGWILTKIDNQEVTKDNITNLLKGVSERCAPHKDIKRLDPLQETKQREV
mmetsp:Transcript_11590/g.28559  ORF Transcript_11590/g.28559 Transcript_11590/m.28559 type:complete len:297 (-) Transcript_11590:251-1141(-)|eukprot:CAMPEP_0114514958 /NCGR_PEP_ID=MMETSP0109-20121206/16447_1 /TAXON_ID=29199 /ORGANISM="Chlorarachnion reptans, Strain CCCM449" /LENGTH=296 /DNA_ID=CAMNT_0001695065 /DNA_START=115 /DNA_END=1005 /DNA_ORIENTATION=+